MDDEEENKPDTTIFLFVNSGSGGGVGAKIFKQEITNMTFEIPINSEKDIRSIEVYFINMKKKRELGFNKLRKLNERKQKTIAIVCGGDGTVMWVVSSFVQFGIDPKDTPIAIIPLGTGNDFSRSLGWGPQKTVLLENNFKSLKKLIRKWLNAKQKMFDLWDVTAEVYENGKFEKVEGGENMQMKEKVLKKTFCNYFSFGIDGKIGYSFDMHRASTRLGNLATYASIGVVKGATHTKSIDELIESFWITKNAEDELRYSENGKCLFQSKAKSEKRKQNDETDNIEPGLMNILALNIDSYTGGVSKIWANGKQIFKNNIEGRAEPSFSDGKIEIVSFGSGTGIALERSIGGMSRRIAQEEGPFRFNFKKYPDQQKHRTYLQMDGEFIRFTHPKAVVLKKSEIVENGQIKILENDPKFQPYQPEE